MENLAHYRGMKMPECIGRIRCPKGKQNRILCPDYQECLDALVIKLLNRHGVATTRFKIREIFNEGENHEYGLSDQIILSRIFNICSKERIKVDKKDLMRAISDSNLTQKERAFLGRLFEPLFAEEGKK